MKKLMIGAIVGAMAFTGCATDKAYSISKAVYKGGKVAVQEIPMDDEKRAKLKKIDKGLTIYDKARTVVRGKLDEGKSSVVSSSQVQK